MKISKNIDFSCLKIKIHFLEFSMTNKFFLNFYYFIEFKFKIYAFLINWLRLFIFFNLIFFKIQLFDRGCVFDTRVMGKISNQGLPIWRWLKFSSIFDKEFIIALASARTIQSSIRLYFPQFLKIERWSL